MYKYFFGEAIEPTDGNRQEKKSLKKSKDDHTSKEGITKKNQKTGSNNIGKQTGKRWCNTSI